MTERLFEPVPESHVGRVRCTACGSTGFETGGRGWQRAHVRGHTPCPGCGRPMTHNLDGRPRKHRHDQCAQAQREKP